MKHTPGPWLQDSRTVYALNDRGFNRFYCSVMDSHTAEHELVANARLIAAAPELLDALENICAGKLDPEEMREIALAAIAKAK